MIGRLLRHTNLDELPQPLTPLEVATCMVFGVEAAKPPLREAGEDSARAVLEQVVAEAFARPPVMVSFSGGRDSSAILALATLVSRRLGVAPPVPVTLRFARCAQTHETTWQEAVVRHLGLDDWARLELDDEVDALGPYARRVLLAHGVLWPPNAHFHAPVFEVGQGGTVLTGAGGDEVMSPHRWLRVAQVLTGRVRPRPRDVLRVGLALSPRWLRVAVLRHRRTAEPAGAWLRPEAARALMDESDADVAADPWRWDAWLRHRWWPSRYRLLAEESLAIMAADLGASVAHPLMDGRFLAAAARQLRLVGFEGRTLAMSRLFSDLIPPALCARSSKASFNSVFFNRHSRAFVADWTGAGVDDRLVDVEALRREWSGEREFDARTLTLLQSAWLAQRPHDVEEAADSRLDRLPGRLPAEGVARQRGKLQQPLGPDARMHEDRRMGQEGR